jgi:hypothetical protein
LLICEIIEVRNILIIGWESILSEKVAAIIVLLETRFLLSLREHLARAHDPHNSIITISNLRIKSWKLALALNFVKVIIV